jgi:hypothetical protein
VDYDDQDNRLLWRPNDPDELLYKRHEWQGGDASLFLFWRLFSGGDFAAKERVLAFARSWGVLGICKHHLPASHNRPLMPFSVDNESDNWCYPLGWPNCWEPLEDWRKLWELLMALFSISMQLKRGAIGEDRDWNTVSSFLGNMGVPLIGWRRGQQFDGPLWKRESDTEWLIFENITKLVLSWGGVSPNFQRRNGRPQLKLDSAGIFGDLVIDIVSAAFSDRRMETCYECGMPYFPTKDLRPDDRPNCQAQECLRRRRNRLARESRHRHRTIKRKRV